MSGKAKLPRQVIGGPASLEDENKGASRREQRQDAQLLGQILSYLRREVESHEARGDQLRELRERIVTAVRAVVVHAVRHLAPPLGADPETYRLPSRDLARLMRILRDADVVCQGTSTEMLGVVRTAERVLASQNEGGEEARVRTLLPVPPETESNGNADA